LRFIVAVADADEAKGGTRCLWYHASDSPVQMEALLSRYRELVARDDALDLLAEMLLPTSVTLKSQDGVGAFGVMLSWLDRALFLLQRDDLNLNGVANKIKHGLVTRARSDLRVDLLEVAPGEEFDTRASVLNGPRAKPLFDAIAVETLGRPRRTEALEHTVLMLRPARLLAEAHMIARVHASAFHVAALKHLGDREAHVPAPYPALRQGPVPEQVHGGHAVGSRRPVTFRKDGSRTDRKRGYAKEQFFRPVTIQRVMCSLRVTDG
jgi:hypothetical protein